MATVGIKGVKGGKGRRGYGGRTAEGSVAQRLNLNRKGGRGRGEERWRTQGMGITVDAAELCEPSPCECGGVTLSTSHIVFAVSAVFVSPLWSLSAAGAAISITSQEHRSTSLLVRTPTLVTSLRAAPRLCSRSQTKQSQRKSDLQGSKLPGKVWDCRDCARQERMA